jgi:uncharacterized protein DUF4350
MPAFIDPGDRRLLIGAVAAMMLLLALTFALRPAPAQQAVGYPSSYSADWEGAKGAFSLLEKLGYRAEHWEAPPEELPTDAAGTTLIFAEPFAGKTSADRAAVIRFVSAGGRLLVIGARGAALAPEATAVEVVDWNPEPKTYSALLPSPLSRHGFEITMIAPDTWTSTTQTQLAIYGEHDKPVVVWYRVGKGQVIWWASPSPLSNGSIREKGNLALFLNSVGPPGSRVLWDEYFHGMRRSLGSYFAETPLPWAGLQIALAFVMVLFTFSRRSGPIRMPVADSRQSPLEFVEALGDLYQSAHAAPVAVEVTYQRLRLSLSRKLGVSAKMKLPELCRTAAARFNWTEATLLGILSHSERAMRDISLDEGEALKLVRELHEYSDRIEPMRKPVEERPIWK